jgi:predicted alpha/beta hydrolase family esterase
MSSQPNIVPVHGAWADGSSWSPVIQRLQADGYHVTAPQFPETSLADDVARLRQVLDRQDGPTIVAGHSYGGQIMTDFVHHFAGDIDPVQAQVMHAVQQPLSTSTFQDVMGVPAWKSHPSWFLVAQNDEAIPPEAERQFAKRMEATTVEIASATWRWSPTPMTWRSSSRPRPKRSRPHLNRPSGTSRRRA